MITYACRSVQSKDTPSRIRIPLRHVQVHGNLHLTSSHNMPSCARSEKPAASEHILTPHRQPTTNLYLAYLSTFVTSGPERRHALFMASTNAGHVSSYECTELLAFVSRVGHVSTSLDSGLPDIKRFHRTSCTKILQGLAPSSLSLVDRWMRSIITHCHTLASVCRLLTRIMHAQTLSQHTQPPRLAKSTQPRLFAYLSRSRVANMSQ